MAAENCRFEHRRAQTHRMDPTRTRTYTCKINSCIQLGSMWIHTQIPTSTISTCVRFSFFFICAVSLIFVCVLHFLFPLCSVGWNFFLSYLLAIRVDVAFTRVTVIYNWTHWKPSNAHRVKKNSKKNVHMQTTQDIFIHISLHTLFVMQAWISFGFFLFDETRRQVETMAALL